MKTKTVLCNEWEEARTVCLSQLIERQNDEKIAEEMKQKIKIEKLTERL